MSLPGFAGVVVAIARVNRAMRDAAENPMDKWRRENVRAAISALPAAILGLAAEFQSKKLHNEDLPMIQKMLGGFVDVNAADNYDKFLRTLNKDLIPQVGAGFPQQYLKQGGNLGMVEGQAGVQVTGNPSLPPENLPQSGSQPKPDKIRETITYNENAPRDNRVDASGGSIGTVSSQASDSQTARTSGTQRQQAASNVMKEVASDISNIEALLNPLQTKSPLDANFFEEKQPTDPMDEQSKKRGKGLKRRPAVEQKRPLGG